VKKITHSLHRLEDGYLAALVDLGFVDGLIMETIVSTSDSTGHYDAAPMGIVKNKDQLTIKPFTSSLTYENLKTTKCAVVNVTSDPKLFYITAFKEANPNGKLSPEMFEKAETVSAPKLRKADATVEVTVNKSRSLSSERAEFLCEVQYVDAPKIFPKVYCRAQFATIEAIVHATRIKPFLKGTEQQQKRALKLLELVDVCQDVVDRTAPNSVYSEIMADLNQRMSIWRSET
jgi:uncharacterized protein